MKRLARLILALVVIAGLSAGGRDAFSRWIDGTVLPPLTVATGVEVVARDGTLLRPYTVADGIWRLSASAAQVDPTYLAMLRAFEDKRFDSHSGVDLRALIRAGGESLRAGRIVSGGSTLTMQVARLLENSGTGAWPGKFRQIRVALALERRLSKAEIMSLYLDLAPFGGNIEGVRAASLTYFGKEPRRLTAAEAALLVALPQAPTLRRPDRNPQAARIGRDNVLRRAAGAGLLTPAALAEALAAPVPSARLPFPAHAPHLADRMVAAEPGVSPLRLTIDAPLQIAMESLAARAVAPRGDRVSAAIVIADHGTGEILSSVGAAAFGAEDRQGYIDMTLAARSPGSTLKPLIYGLAFDAGLAHPETLMEDQPTRFGTYAPQNFDRQFHGTVRAREALQMSLNIPAVALTEALGPARLLAALKRAGLEPSFVGAEPGLAIALGGIGLSLEDMAQLYAALARGGVALRLSALPGQAGTLQRVLSPQAAWQVGDILSGLAPPPGAPANRLAYKTGTSYGHRDAWAIGYDGRTVIAVWMGRPDGTPVPGAFGGEFAAPVLFEAFSLMKPQLDPLPLPPPATLLLPTADLPLPLQRFRPPQAARRDGPVLSFPPEGAVVEPLDGHVAARVERGQPPFTWLRDGRPIVKQGSGRELLLPLDGPGTFRLSVIDGQGRSAAVTFSVPR